MRPDGLPPGSCRDLTSPPVTPAEVGERFRAARRRDTIANALRLPFYQDLWSAQAGADQLELSELATFGKGDYIERFHLFWTEDLLRSTDLWANHTSGTTGSPTYRYRTQAEVEYAERFLARRRERRGVTGEERVVLSALSGSRSHGNALRAPGGGDVVVLPDTALTSPEELADWVTRPHLLRGRSRRATAMVAEQSILERATSGLHVLGWPEHSVTALSSCGTYARPYVRERMEALWSATVVEVFSASEVFGGAVRCRRCGWFHPHPYVQYDAVSLTGAEPVTEGLGLLVLSELFPLTQGQPFVRYRTGDLVEVGPAECPVDRFAFRFLGRMPDQRGPMPAAIGWELVPVLGEGWSQVPLLRPSELIASLDVLPNVVRRPVLGSTDDPAGIGVPGVRVRLISGPIPELRVSIAVGPPHGQATARAITAAVQDRQPELARAVANGVITLSVGIVDALDALEAADPPGSYTPTQANGGSPP